jgi:hypothetical protein
VDRRDLMEALAWVTRPGGRAGPTAPDQPRQRRTGEQATLVPNYSLEGPSPPGYGLRRYVSIPQSKGGS